MFGFKKLCGEARGVADYLAIARKFHTVILVGIPKLGPENRNEAARFVAMPFGGGGALHVSALIRQIGLKCAIVHRLPGITPALG